jgi:hypothetical protein
VRSLPAAVRDAHTAEVKALKALLKEVQATLRSERGRVEAILATDRTLPAADWSRYYLAHPLTGPHARRLIWEVAARPDGPWAAGLPAPAESGAGTAPWRLRAADGTVRDVQPDDTVRVASCAVRAADLRRR